jgi:hypothetical protein
MASLHTLDRLLEHLIDVESEMITLSARGHRSIAEWIKETKLEASDEVLEAMQYQDIFSQQLGATIEAIESVRALLAQNMETEIEEDSAAMVKIGQMDSKLVDVLEKAQQKRAAFSGKTDPDDEGIEFF